MARQRNQPDIFQNYILPLILAIVILAVSQFLNLISISHLIEACILCAIIICGLFIGQYTAFRMLRLQERDALYSILSIISFSGSHNIPRSGVLTDGDVLGIESAAREVWIYAYDLKYERLEGDHSAFTNAVIQNLERNVKYLYLIPNSSETILRAERLQSYLQRFTHSSDQLTFLISPNPPVFNQFSVTLYNPDLVSDDRNDTESRHTIAVFFPHPRDFELSDRGGFTPFIAVRDSGALEIQEKFEAMVREAKPLERKPTLCQGPS